MRSHRPSTLRAALLGLAAFAFAGISLLASSGTALAAGVQFGTPSARSVFGTGIDFSQPYTASAAVTSASIWIRVPSSIGPAVTQLQTVPQGSLAFTLDTSKGELLPNDTVVAHWELTLADGSVAVGPEVTVVYTDTRFSWITATSGLVRLHLYGYTSSRAQSWAKIGSDALANAVSYIGATETKPVDVFVYPDQQAFMAALGPGTTENVGGLANEAARTVYALIEPSYTGFASSVIPHELTHVVFDDATRSPYTRPPHWLNEGIAVYLSDGYGSSDRSQVKQAAQNGTLMPLRAIPGDFPSSADRFNLAYAEAVSAVDYFVKTYGKPALNTLLLTYGKGATDDEAFDAAIGKTIDEFDAEWLSAQGVKSTPTYGPLPAPTGPLPPGWSADGASPAPGTSSTPGVSSSPSSTGTPVASQTQGSHPSTSPASGGSASTSSRLTTSLIVAGVLATIGLAVLAVAVMMHSAQRRV